MVLLGLRPAEHLSRPRMFPRTKSVCGIFHWAIREMTKELQSSSHKECL